MDGLIISKVAYVCENKELETRMNLINEALKDGEKALFTIGRQLKEIKTDELWKNDYKDFVDCASQFNIKKAQAYNLIKAYEIKEKYKLEDYTSTHCLQIARLESKKGEKFVKAALEKGQIKQEMSVSKLKEFVDKKLGLDKKSLECKNTKAVETEQESETEQTTETEQTAETKQTAEAVAVKKQFVCFMLNDGKWDITSNFDGVTDEQMKALKVALKTLLK